MRKNKLRKLLVFILVFAWLFTGWPPIWQNPRIPPKIHEAQAAVAFKTFAISTPTTATVTFTIPIPATIAADEDLYVLFVSRDHLSGTALATLTDNDTGGNTWTRIGGSTDRKLNVFWKKSTSGTASKTITVAGCVGSCAGGMSAFTGGAAGDPTTNFVVEDNAAADETHAGFTPDVADSFIVFGVINPTNDLDITLLAAATLGALEPEQWAAESTGGSDCKSTLTGKVNSGTTATGNFTWAQTDAITRSVSFAIKPSDTAAPTPNPMTFASAPTNDSATQISMTATTGTDATPPVNYLFTNDNSGCGANAGTGGTTSSWQSTTSYSDSLLDPNKCYGYTVTARDSVATPNTGTASSISSTYTSANTPGTPTLTGATLTTLNLTNAENSNPAANPTTNFAVQVVTTTPNDSTWLNQWVNASGNPSATAVWLTDAQLDALVLQGLNYGTTYGVKVKAKNQDEDETPLSVEGQGTTTAAIISVTITTEDKTVPYGILDFGGVKSTIDLSKTKTAQNNGNVAEDFTIKTSAATAGTGTNWALGSSAGTNVFVHEFSSNGGGVWTKFTTADEYSLTPLVTNIGVGTTQNFDLRITVPTSSDNIQKTITVTVRATQY